MSSGRTHRLVNVTALIVPGAVALAWFFGEEYSVGWWQSLAALGGGYLLSTIGINPDQDIARRTFAERQSFWGLFLYIWTLPYGILFKHRGISHEHVIGTITRVLIMGLWIPPVVMLVAMEFDWVPVAHYSGWVFLGLTVADSMHIAADGGRRQLEHTE